METKLSDWIVNFKYGRYSIDKKNPFMSKLIAVDAGWYDWFCDCDTLLRKTKEFGEKIIQLSKSSKINTEKMYVWFKNSVGYYGNIFDFRFADINSGDVQYTITHEKITDKKMGWVVYGIDNNWREPILVGTWNDVKKYFGVK